MSLLNIRISDEDLRMIRALRSQGIKVASLVRDAIRSEYARRSSRKSARDVRAILQDIYARHPEPSDAPPRGFDVHDRRQFARAFAEHLKKSRK